MFFASPAPCVRRRSGGGNTASAAHGHADRRRADRGRAARSALASGLLAAALLAGAASLPAPLAADTGLSPELQAALSQAIADAGASGGPWAPPPALAEFLAAQPERALEVASFVAALLGAQPAAASGESKCACAAGLATALGSAQPGRAADIRGTLSAASPGCRLDVTAALEESLAATSSEPGPKPRPQKGFALTQPGGGGGGGGGCQGPCAAVEPGNAGMVSQSAF